MKRLQNELTSLANRGMDCHLCLAITGLRRSGKTSFITALVNQLLHVQSGRACRYFRQHARGVCWVSNALRSVTWASSALPMIRGLAQLYGTPASWLIPTRGVSEIYLTLRYRSNSSPLHHFKETSTLYLEIIDYPGGWLLDLPMLEQDYLVWSRQVAGLLQGNRAQWAKP